MAQQLRSERNNQNDVRMKSADKEWLGSVMANDYLTGTSGKTSRPTLPIEGKRKLIWCEHNLAVKIIRCPHIDSWH